MTSCFAAYDHRTPPFSLRACPCLRPFRSYCCCQDNAAKTPCPFASVLRHRGHCGTRRRPDARVIAQLQQIHGAVITPANVEWLMLGAFSCGPEHRITSPRMTAPLGSRLRPDTRIEPHRLQLGGSSCADKHRRYDYDHRPSESCGRGARSQPPPAFGPSDGT